MEEKGSVVRVLDAAAGRAEVALVAADCRRVASLVDVDRELHRCVTAALAAQLVHEVDCHEAVRALPLVTSGHALQDAANAVARGIMFIRAVDPSGSTRAEQYAARLLYSRVRARVSHSRATLVDELARWVGARFAAEEEQRQQIDALQASEPSFMQSMCYLGLHDEFLDAVSLVMMDRVRSLVEESVQASQRCVDEDEGGEEHEETLESVHATLRTVHDWLTSSVRSFLRRTLRNDEDKGAGAEHALTANIMARLELYGAERVAQARIGQLFDLIVDYPTSAPALLDLREALAHSNMSGELVSSFTDTLKKRLLHAGARTQDIIFQFVNILKVFSVLDPSSAMVSTITQPLRAYLRSRPDTIRCFMSSISQDGELRQELRARGLIQEEDVSGLCQHDELWDGPLTAEVLQTKFGAWSPPLSLLGAPRRPGEAAQSGVVSALEPTSPPPGLDILGTFVQVYEGRGPFVKEFQSMLATRLLSAPEYDLNQETVTLELFKARFGDSVMHECGVMLRDVLESRRLQNSFETVLSPGEKSGTDGLSVEFPVLSHMFWPSDLDVFDDTAEQTLLASLPSTLVEQLEAFQQQYAKMKAPRKLRWHFRQGSVHSVIEMADGRRVSVHSTPFALAVLQQFQQDGVCSERSVPTLREMLRLPESEDVSIRAALRVWVQYGIVGRSGSTPGAFELIEHESQKRQEEDTDEDRGGGDELDDVDPAESASSRGAASATMQAMQVYESYIIGMLQNFDSLPLERIHNMLKIFVVAPAYDKTQAQLAEFLDALIDAEKIELVRGAYQLAKTP
ncbi:Anaphase-promoting complex subunit 2 [Porphyridium purpureum]|uniref:Anaphase-promoting complex subunit 2 n=1 Tax=Porphyridium purpureum TaxID=35688 RepID=A0A5J4YK83_PORPP|nr:Anaphase-promoting complex subunit 2 [Porphyridium purpureum]|eukprot:POR0867..scf297_16